MDEFAIARYVLDTFPNVQTSENFGYSFFFFGDNHRLPFATIASSDNECETVSKLDRPGVFRLNIGVSKQTFQSLFGPGEASLADYDLAELDRFMPHPDYAWQSFVCILNPGDANLPMVLDMLREAYAMGEKRYESVPRPSLTRAASSQL